jgi:hypothetical protein
MRASAAALALGVEGVEHVMWLARDAHDRPSEAIVQTPDRRELRFAPGGDARDARGLQWSLDGALDVIDATVEDGRIGTPAYPDALERVWSALISPTAGELLLSAGDGYEFMDWGRQAHVGGGSHGALGAGDSLGALVLCGVALPAPEPAQWSIRDVAPLVLAHFGIEPDVLAPA